MTARARFTHGDVVRLLRAVRAADLEPLKLQIAPCGTLSVHFSHTSEDDPPSLAAYLLRDPHANEWSDDDV